jgi:hypothetical protein
MDDITLAVLSGLFGPNIARRLTKFRYRAIFIGTILGMYLIVFAILIYDGGLRYAISAFVSKTFTFVGILVPVGIASLAVLCAFIASLGPRGE